MGSEQKERGGSEYESLLYDIQCTMLNDENRNKRLESIVRYRNYPHKLFPTHLKSHQHQVVAMVLELNNYIWMYIYDCGLRQRFDIDLNRAVVMAYIHDDHEPFMEALDFQSANELHITQDEKFVLQNDEYQAIEKAIGVHGALMRQDSALMYGELLWDSVMQIGTLESQFVKLCDKLVGLGEALHELSSGNNTFAHGVVDPQYNRMNVAPTQYYELYLAEFDKHLPLLSEAIDFNKWFCTTPFTDGLLKRHYKLWVNAIVNHAPQWEQERLFSRK